MEMRSLFVTLLVFLAGQMLYTGETTPSVRTFISVLVIGGASLFFIYFGVDMFWHFKAHRTTVRLSVQKQSQPRRADEIPTTKNVSTV